MLTKTILWPANYCSNSGNLSTFPVPSSWILWASFFVWKKLFVGLEAKSFPTSFQRYIFKQDFEILKQKSMENLSWNDKTFMSKNVASLWKPIVTQEEGFTILQKRLYFFRSQGPPSGLDFSGDSFFCTSVMIFENLGPYLTQERLLSTPALKRAIL